MALDRYAGSLNFVDFPLTFVEIAPSPSRISSKVNEGPSHVPEATGAEEERVV